MIHAERVELLNKKAASNGKYVLYWMQAAQRLRCNHALQYAVRTANERKKPVVAVFALTDDFPDANLRHYHFLLHGLAETAKDLAKRNIKLVIRIGSPEKVIAGLTGDADLVVVDAGRLRIQRQWRSKAAKAVGCSLYQVESDLIVPVHIASEKENFSAGTFRPRITAHLKDYLVSLRECRPKHSSMKMKFDSLETDKPDDLLEKLNIDKTVEPVDDITPGYKAAKHRLRYFIKNKLANYASDRNDPNIDGQSGLSPYLHFGQISPLEVALAVQQSDGPNNGKDAFLEELIVRRELAHNFVYYNDKYDSFECLEPWAKRSLAYHAKDKREYTYTLSQLEQAKTHDPYWNAAQMQMVKTGKMHGYMRMYWGKKILEWSKTHKQAFDTALWLNNKYELDGRDPNGYAGVAWCFGKHDRAWSDRKVFGKVRYMNASGLKRKFDADAYAEKMQNL